MNDQENRRIATSGPATRARTNYHERLASSHHKIFGKKKKRSRSSAFSQPLHPKLHHIPIDHNILLPFRTHPTLLARGSP
jgi:hypothetical protein